MLHDEKECSELEVADCKGKVLAVSDNRKLNQVNKTEATMVIEEMRNVPAKELWVPYNPKEVISSTYAVMSPKRTQSQNCQQIKKYCAKKKQSNEAVISPNRQQSVSYAQNIGKTQRLIINKQKK